MTQVEIARQRTGHIALSCYRTDIFPYQPFFYSVEQMCDHTYRHLLVNRDKQKGVIFQYTFAGLGELIFNGKRHLVPPGKAFLALTPSPCTYMQSPEEDFYHFISIQLLGEAAQEIAQRIIGKTGAVLEISPDSRALEILCEHFNLLMESHSIEDFHEDAIFGYRFLMTLLKEQEPNPSPVKEKMPVFLEKTLAFIEQNLENTLLDVNALAAHAHLSVFYFSRLFTEYLGCSPRKYLQAQRLFLAAQLLANDFTLPLKTIIERCGFTSASYFCKSFRRAYRTSPGSYRNLYKFHREKTGEGE